MFALVILSNLIIAVSIVVVWVFRFDNIVKEFQEYNLPPLVRNMVGAAKMVLSTLLVAGLWFPVLIPVPALMMAFLMGCAQAAHAKVKNPLSKRIPSLVLLLLSLFSAAAVWFM
ncbi:DoxX family protein [Alkalicoccus chagannorensis]|uniref:DoxX family protein n=1 Tax=Alkalicoccus chagannorensis TaxID=427072 RepID=UPI0004013D82|nr:DoxX family protein [Alkalicoccus chagannorensis]